MPRRPPPRRPLARAVLASAVALVATLAATATASAAEAGAPALTLAAPGAVADPIVPPGADDVVRALAEANARAEQANEAAMGAEEQLPLRRADADRTRQAADAARAATARARADQDQAYVAVDALTRSSFQGGDLDQLGALLTSPDPRDYLDKISLLDTVATEDRAVLQRFLDATAAADTAQHDADTRAVDADRAASDAERTAQDAVARKADADREVAAAEAAYRNASAADRAALRGGGITNYPVNIPGQGVAIDALRVALTQQGKPYVWGAEGPNTYDCSGLVQWAYRQVGVGLPRVSQSQQFVGDPVAPEQAQVGDLLFFNNPATHVGIYVGNGQFLEAPQSGDVVKVAPVLSSLSSIRRIVL